MEATNYFRQLPEEKRLPAMREMLVSLEYGEAFFERWYPDVDIAALQEQVVDG